MNYTVYLVFYCAMHNPYCDSLLAHMWYDGVIGDANTNEDIYDREKTKRVSPSIPVVLPVRMIQNDSVMLMIHSVFVAFF